MRERFRAKRRRLKLSEKGIAGKIMTKIEREREMVSEKMLREQYEAFDREMNEVNRMAKKKNENEETGLVFGERDGEKAFKEEDRAGSREKM